MPEINDNVPVGEQKPNEVPVGDGNPEAPKDEPKAEKPEETPEQKLGRLKRMVTQEEKRQGVSEKPATKDEPKKTKSGEIDYGKLAYLKAEGIQGDDVALIEEVMESTGQSLTEAVESKHVQAMIKERKDARVVAEATPSSTNRSNNTSRDKVDYWLAKGELPPKEAGRELRIEYVKAKQKSEKPTAEFL